MEPVRLNNNVELIKHIDQTIAMLGFVYPGAEVSHEILIHCTLCHQHTTVDDTSQIGPVMAEHEEFSCPALGHGGSSNPSDPSPSETES